MIETTQLTKVYGDLHALSGIDLRVEPGDLYGFIGPNGAGKTTTIRILTTLLEPDGGDARVGGHSVWEEKAAVRRLIGYMPDSFGTYRDMTVAEYLHFFAAAYEVPSRDRTGLVGGLLELTDLEGKRDALVDTLSRGMQQRLGLARTLVHDPKVLVLDEPASGLDPRARIEIREILKELQRMGKTILLSSHILSELHEVCTRVGILERGRLAAQGTIDEVMAQAGEIVSLELRTTDDARAKVELEALPVVTAVELRPAGLVVTLAPGADSAALAAHLHEKGLGLRVMAPHRMTLEDAFMRLTKGLVQ